MTLYAYFRLRNCFEIYISRGESEKGPSASLLIHTLDLFRSHPSIYAWILQVTFKMRTFYAPTLREGHIDLLLSICLKILFIA